MEMDKGCPELTVCNDSLFGEHLGTTVQNKDGDWEPALKNRRESLVEFVM